MQNAERDGAPVISPEAAAILRDIRVGSDGAVATVSLHTPAQKVLDFLAWAKAQNRAKALKQAGEQPQASALGSTE
jgi:hypothetical protein